MLDKFFRRFFVRVLNHFSQHLRNGKEAVARLAHIVETIIIEQDLLDNEGGDCLTQFIAIFHDMQTQRDSFRLDQELSHLAVGNDARGGVGHHIGMRVLDQGANHTERGQTQVLKRTRVELSVQERIQEQGNVGLEEEATCLWMRGDTLQQGERIAAAIAVIAIHLNVATQVGVHTDHFLNERRNHSGCAPQQWREVGIVLAQFTQRRQRMLTILQLRQLLNVVHNLTRTVVCCASIATATVLATTAAAACSASARRMLFMRLQSFLIVDMLAHTALNQVGGIRFRRDTRQTNDTIGRFADEFSVVFVGGGRWIGGSARLDTAM